MRATNIADILFSPHVVFHPTQVGYVAVLISNQTVPLWAVAKSPESKLTFHFPFRSPVLVHQQVSSRDFLLGFAILQAFPGPNFNFAVYLGLLALAGRNPALGAFLGYLGIFTPGILLKLAMLPLYSRWRRYNTAKSVLRGLNAAAAGLVYTAVWQLFLGTFLSRLVQFVGRDHIDMLPLTCS